MTSESSTWGSVVIFLPPPIVDNGDSAIRFGRPYQRASVVFSALDEKRATIVWHRGGQDFAHAAGTARRMTEDAYGPAEEHSSLRGDIWQVMLRTSDGDLVDRIAVYPHEPLDLIESPFLRGPSIATLSPAWPIDPDPQRDYLGQRRPTGWGPRSQRLAQERAERALRDQSVSR